MTPQEIASKLTNGAKALLCNTPDDAQIYDYTSSFIASAAEAQTSG